MENPSRLTARTWFVLILLAITEQIAWAMENSWFNTFVFDERPPPIRTPFMGTLSDRMRSR